jgi:hypothetical protein
MDGLGMPEPARGEFQSTDARTRGRRTITRQLTLACARPCNHSRSLRTRSKTGQMPESGRPIRREQEKGRSNTYRALDPSVATSDAPRPRGRPTTSLRPAFDGGRRPPPPHPGVGRSRRDVRRVRADGAIDPSSFARIVSRMGNAALASERLRAAGVPSSRQTPVTSRFASATRREGAVR